MNEMRAPLFALLTAFCLGAGDFSSHYGLRRVRPLTGAFFIICFQLLTLSAALLIRGRWDIPDWRGPIFFLVSGVLHPGVFFFFLLTAIQRLGPARAITLKSTSPFFGVAMAVLFLAERPSPSVLLGVFLVVGGVMYLTADRRLGGDVPGLLYVVAAAFFSGLGPVLAKAGLGALNDTMLGPLFAMTGGAVTLFLGNTVFVGSREGAFWLRAPSAKAVLLFLPMGVLGALGWIFYYTALTYGSVSVVIPLVQTAPFVTLLLSRLLVQEQERVTLRLVISAVFIFLGAVLIALGRA